MNSHYFLSVVAAATLLLSCNLPAAENSIVLGLAQGDAAKHDTEFLTGNPMASVYQENHIVPSLLEFSGFYGAEASEEDLYKLLKQFHVVQLGTTHEGVEKLTPVHIARAKRVGAALVRYVNGGGGLFLQPLAVRYPQDQDEKYWNLVLEPLGAQLLHEGDFDKSRQFEDRTIAKALFWWTQNIVAHPVTEGVKTLYLPLHGYGPFPGLVAMKYSADWQVVVRGESEAESYRSGEDNLINVDAPGSYTSAPPVVAVRQLGKGRIVCYPIEHLFTGMNYNNPLWPNTVETAGDKTADRPSQSLKLQFNAYRWLAEPAQGDPAFGTHKRPAYKPVEFPQSVVQCAGPFADPVAGIRAIAGAHTAYTDGTGSVPDYVKAAKAAGLAAIVFADPLEKLTPEKLAQLKADCAAASDATFYACPGIEFTDGIGTRWAFWGEKVGFPEGTFKSGTFTHTQWDGQRVQHYGKFAEACGFPGSAILDYRQLAANGAHRENLWWFWNYLPLVYDRDRLLADNYGEYLFGLHDLRWCALASFTRIRTPDDVALAVRTLVTGYQSVARAKEALNARCCAAPHGDQYVSQGPVIIQWAGQNTQLESNWRYTRGAQRVRLKFVVRSDAGIADVKVHDADRGVVRRYAGNGAPELAREFEVVHDRQQHLTLEVTDTAGKRAFSQQALVFSYKGDLFRCGDNLNILCAPSLIWHPDRNQMLQIFRPFGNGEQFALHGWDTGVPLVPMPRAESPEQINIQGTGLYPTREAQHAMLGKLMDVPLANYGINIATMRMTKLAETFDDANRPTPAMATVPRDVGDNEFFERTHTIVNPMDRLDHYVIWNYRRGREGQKDYRGGLMWNEGEIHFKKDVTLAGSVPIPLVELKCPTDLEKNWGTTVVVTDTNGQTRVGLVRATNEVLRMDGHIRPGGYASQMTSLVGYLGFLAPQGSDFTYHSELPRRLVIGLGENGQQVKAGTVMKYRFVMGTFIDHEAGNAQLEHVTQALNLGGGRSGYPVTVKTGEITDALFFFTAKAKRNEAAFTLGPQQLPIDLPIRVAGLDDNGCVAVSSHVRPWFRFVPVVGDTAYLQESIDDANEMWVGNVFVSDNKHVKLTLVVDGQPEGEKPFLEIHNPTDKAIQTKVWSPPHTPRFGGRSATVKVPAGDSVRLELDEKG